MSVFSVTSMVRKVVYDLNRSVYRFNWVIIEVKSFFNYLIYAFGKQLNEYKNRYKIFYVRDTIPIPHSLGQRKKALRRL
jgi:hypothetical protein